MIVFCLSLLCTADMAEHDPKFAKFPRTRRNFRSGFGTSPAVFATSLPYQLPTRRDDSGARDESPSIDDLTPSGSHQIDGSVVISGHQHLTVHDDGQRIESLDGSPHICSQAGTTSPSSSGGFDEPDGIPISTRMPPYRWYDLIVNIVSILS